MSQELPAYPETLNLERYKSLILTHEQYRDSDFARLEKPSQSYVFEIIAGEKKILFFGASHSNDPDNPMFEEIQSEFIKLEPDIVYVEGAQRINVHKDIVRERMEVLTLQETKSQSESRFTLKLGVDSHIDFESPEPLLPEEISFLTEKSFSRKDIFTFYAYRVIDQYQRENKIVNSEECKNYTRSYLREFKEVCSWSKEELNTFEEVIFTELAIEDKEKYKNEVDPIPWEGHSQSNLNEISRCSSDFRDSYIFKRITEGLKKYNTLFIVYGSAHAVKLEPALRAFMEEAYNDAESQ